MNLKYTTSFTKMTEELTYKVYNKTRLVVRGDKSKYGGIISNLGGRWYGKLKDGPGWTISRDKEPELKKLTKVVQEDQNLNNMKTSAKSRKNQKKYHRAISEKESDEESDEDKKEEEEENVETSDEESSDGNEQAIKNKIHKPLRNKRENRKKHTSSRHDDILTYYKSFAQSPKQQRRYVPSDSSSDEDTSSDDSLNYAQSPRRDRNVEYNELAQKMRNMQRRLFEVELRLKKKKKRN